MTPGTPQVPLLLCGPTAVGKSSLALDLALRLNAEIVSVDSMQVYRGMDIGTAKPSPAERARVPHHLLDVVGLDEPFDAAAFVQMAGRSVQEIQSRGRLPLLCGGTGLYLKAYLCGLGEAPPADPDLRAQLRKIPLESLLAELAAVDPAAYERIDRQNPRRVIRAIEVIRLTGRPFSAQRSQWARDHDPRRGVCIGLSRTAADLRRRIDARVDRMFEGGLIEETKRLVAQGLEQNLTAALALGYRQTIEHLHGRHTLDQTINLVKIRTWQYAKKQMTWFRRQLNVNWIQLEADSTSDEALEQILAAYGRCL